jgi:hypothetical protein
MTYTLTSRPSVTFGLVGEAALPGSPLSSLAEARAVPDGAVILMRARRTAVYATCPASLVQCDSATLARLAADIDLLVWPELPPGGTVSFEQQAIGARLAGDYGGGRVVPGIWVHDRLADMGMGPRIRHVLERRSPRLIAPREWVYAVARVDEQRLRPAARNRLSLDAYPDPLPIEVVRLAARFEDAEAVVTALNASRAKREADRPRSGTPDCRVYYLTWGPLRLPA